MATPHPVTITDWLVDIRNDSNDAPWMVMPGYQLWALHMLLSVLVLHRKEQRLRWYIGSRLLVRLPRPGLPSLDVAPDLFITEGDTHSRTSWDIWEEGQPPRFVLEVVTDVSWDRDTSEKRDIYNLIGVEEYAIFAPLRADEGPKLFGYRRGVLGRWEAWAEEKGGLRSRALGGLLLKVVEADDTLLRLYDPQERLLLSHEEAARHYEELARRHEQTARQHEQDALLQTDAPRCHEQDVRRHADAEAQRANAETQRAEAAEAQAAALEAELARLRHAG